MLISSMRGLLDTLLCCLLLVSLVSLLLFRVSEVLFTLQEESLEKPTLLLSIILLVICIPMRILYLVLPTAVRDVRQL